MNQSELILASIARQESIISGAEKEIERLKRELWNSHQAGRDQLLENKHLREELQKALQPLPQVCWFALARKAMPFLPDSPMKYLSIRLDSVGYDMPYRELSCFGAEWVAERFVREAGPLIKTSVLKALEKCLCVSVST